MDDTEPTVRQLALPLEGFAEFVMYPPAYWILVRDVAALLRCSRSFASRLCHEGQFREFYGRQRADRQSIVRWLGTSEHPDLVATPAAAAWFDVSRQQIRTAIQAGDLPGRKLGISAESRGVYRVDRAPVLADVARSIGPDLALKKSERWLTLESAADALRCEPAVLVQGIRDAVLPCQRLGGRCVRIHPAVVRAMRAGRTPSARAARAL